MIIVNPVQDHLKHKKILLKMISNFIHFNDTSVTRDKANLGDDDKVYKPLQSDFFLPSKLKRPYLEYFCSDVIMPTVESVGKSLRLEPFDFKIHGLWFQQYSESGEHSWHNHPTCQFTNVYYLEMPEDEYKTEVVGLDGELIEYTAKEGDLLTIHSWMMHRSKPNGTKRKTIIAFNSSYIARATFGDLYHRNKYNGN